MRPILASIMLLALCACSPSETKSEDAATVNAIDYPAKIEGLPERQRNGVFLRAIRDAGLPCQNVTASQRVDDGDGMPMWRAYCEDGKPHLVQVMLDGTANVVSLADR